jgi:hypothetical protein
MANHLNHEPQNIEYRISNVEYRRKRKLHHWKFLVRYSIFKKGVIERQPGI